MCTPNKQCGVNIIYKSQNDVFGRRSYRSFARNPYYNTFLYEYSSTRLLQTLQPHYTAEH